MSSGRRPNGERIFPGTPQFHDLVERVIYQESKGNAKAVSPAGAAGLMQVMPATARDPGFGVKPLDWSQRFNPQANRAFGEDYLGKMLTRYDGDPTRALVAYNAGPGTADRWGGDPRRLNSESRGYVSNIMQNPSFGTPQYGPQAYRGVKGAGASAGNMSAQASVAATQAMANHVSDNGMPSGEGLGMGAQPANSVPGAQIPGGMTDMMNLQALAAQPAGFSRPTQTIQAPQSKIGTPLKQSGSRGPLNSVPQIQVGSLIN